MLLIGRFTNGKPYDKILEATLKTSRTVLTRRHKRRFYLLTSESFRFPSDVEAAILYR